MGPATDAPLVGLKEMSRGLTTSWLRNHLVAIRDQLRTSGAGPNQGSVA
jgi:hypothetical protein